MCSSAQPLTLAEVLRIALSENPLPAAWDAKVRAGEGELLSARAYPNPEPSQMLELPAKRKYRRQAAEMDLKAISYERECLILNLIFEVKSAFYNVLLAQKVFEVAQDNLQSAQTLLNSANVRVEVGEAPEFELIKAHVEVASASNEVQKAATSVSLAEVALKTLLGRPGNTQLEVREKEAGLTSFPCSMYI